MAKRATKVPAGQADTPKTYVATREITHNGEIYEAGETIELGIVHAQPLLDCGAIEKAAPAA